VRSRTEWRSCYGHNEPFIVLVYIVHVVAYLLSALSSGITSTIFPSRPPPLFPVRAVEFIFAQLVVNSIMCLTHPRTKFASTTHPRCVLGHPALEVFCAHPAWIQFREGGEEGLGLRLQLWGGLRRIGSGYGVQECPRAAPEGFDVGRTVGGECGGDRGSGALLCGFGRVLRLAAGHGEPGSHIGAGTASACPI
jgi:hypothetical protein